MPANSCCEYTHTRFVAASFACGKAKSLFQKSKKQRIIWTFYLWASYTSPDHHQPTHMKSVMSKLLAGGFLMPLVLSAQNLLVNPGFEEGTQNDAPPWAVGGWRGSVRAVTTEKHSGRRSIMIEGG